MKLPCRLSEIVSIVTSSRETGESDVKSHLRRARPDPHRPGRATGSRAGRQALAARLRYGAGERPQCLFRHLYLYRPVEEPGRQLLPDPARRRLDVVGYRLSRATAWPAAQPDGADVVDAHQDDRLAACRARRETGTDRPTGPQPLSRR